MLRLLGNGQDAFWVVCSYKEAFLRINHSKVFAHYPIACFTIQSGMAKYLKGILHTIDISWMQIVLFHVGPQYAAGFRTTSEPLFTDNSQQLFALC